MIIDKLGKIFEDRRKKDEKVKVERRKEDNKIRVGNKTNKTKK